MESIFDFRELEYTWGDQMGCLLDSPTNWNGNENVRPVVVIVSDLNREGLTSLVRDEMWSEPAEWLADSVEQAVSMLQSKFLHRQM